MANIYLKAHGAVDAGDGLSWANAKDTLAAAVTAAGAGGTVWMSNNHTQSVSAPLAVSGTADPANPVRVVCVDDSAEPPTTRVSTPTGVVATASSSATMTFHGFAYYYGVNFHCGSGAAGSNDRILFGALNALGVVLENCNLKYIGTTPTGAGYTFGGTGASTEDDQRVELINCGMQFGNVANTIIVRCPTYWRGGSVLSAGASPTIMFSTPIGNPGGWMEVTGVDLSHLGSGKTLVNMPGTFTRHRFINCKLGASVAMTTGSAAGQGGILVEAINCDSGATNTKYYFEDYTGCIFSEATIVRTGGASDGTTPLSYKFVSTANSKFYFPLRGPWATLWNETTGSPVTVTVEVVTDGVTLTNADAWIEVEHLGTTSFPQAIIENDQIADPIFGTPANQDSSSVTWTTTGLTTPIKQKLHKAVTPYHKGPIRARVVLAKPSTTLYADLKLAA